MLKQKLKLLEKIEEKGKILFLGKADLDSINFFSKENKVKAVFTNMHEKNEVDRTIKKENLKTVFVNSFEEIKKEFDFSVVFHEDFLGRKGTLELIETAGKKTKLKGKIYFFCKTSRGAKNFQKNMKELFGNSETVSVKGGLRLIASEKEKEIIETKKGKEETETKKLVESGKDKNCFGFELRKEKYFFESSFGVFSKKKVDEGTKLLLESLEKIEGKKILDFGCGLGIIGVVLAKENPEKSFLLIDSDAKAVNLAEKNIELNKMNNAKTIVSDGFGKIKGMFDLIVSNPPTHEKRVFLEKFVFESFNHLEKNGRIVLVLNKAVFLEKELEKVFGNCKILAEGKEHKVIEAVKD